ncbi:hypothetical protein DKK75_07070 [Bifidobacterium asteroides]|uniref:Uncharacterized protein n=1 Tax=Bifidobacterium asteroides TaxID=1684 RepID=A0A318M053_9BIFI|nr:hypothetical protein DKK75_07070 [Bifidobacterium asteroides]
MTHGFRFISLAV